ncbi:MAG: hypothetical protein EXX96DRAFT_474512 [Benjaminiella poitrasii]|nr:MAG: hypothetical protein EXX96DRAFT_474512 [Benjaminiella poitrasii]
MIGHLSNKPFINLIYFLKANNPRYKSSYSFGLWSYCQGQYNAPIQNCSRAVAAYDWARTPGFDQMLPTYAASTHVSRVFLALFILYFISLILSFLLWLTTLLFIFGRVRRTKGYHGTMAILSALNLVIMLIVLILSLIVVITSAKIISRASIYWSGYAGNAVWLTIAAVFAWLFATLCYLFRACLKNDNRRSSYQSTYGNNHIFPTLTREKEYESNRPFDLTQYHQPYMHQPLNHPLPTVPQVFVVRPHQQQHQQPIRHQQQPLSVPIEPHREDRSVVSHVSKQYTPSLQPHFLSPTLTAANKPNDI